MWQYINAQGTKNFINFLFKTLNAKLLKNIVIKKMFLADILVE